jgi:hypothetical protein
MALIQEQIQILITKLQNLIELDNLLEQIPTEAQTSIGLILILIVEVQDIIDQVVAQDLMVHQELDQVVRDITDHLDQQVEVLEEVVDVRQVEVLALAIQGVVEDNNVFDIIFFNNSYCWFICSEY